MTAEETINLISEECDFVKNHLIKKNKAYGNSFADPIGIFSKLAPMEQLNVRIDDKLKRILNTNEAAKAEVAEDTDLDLIGYLVLRRVLKRMGIES